MITHRVRPIVEGKARGQVLYSSEPIQFLQGVDPEKGVVSDPKSPIYDIPFSGKVLVFPNTVGSSVGAYVIYRLKKNGKAPKAILNQTTDITTASGCAIAGIPLFDLPENDISILQQVKAVAIDAKNSELIIIDG